MRNEFYRDSQAVILVYDVTSKTSFEALDVWLNELKYYLNEPSEWGKVVCILCANKIDRSDRVISAKRGEEWAKTNGFYYLETSAQSGEGVQNTFHVMFKALSSVIETGKRPKSTEVIHGKCYLPFISSQSSFRMTIFFSSW